MDFIDEDRNRIKFTLKEKTSGKNVTRMVDLQDTEASCGCGYLEVHEIPCGCVALAAEKKGVDIGAFLDDHDTVKTWKQQYVGLPAFKIPGSEDILLLPDDGLAPLPPVTYPQKAGRPSMARIKSAGEQYRKYKKPKGN
jgi:hypothetical protein